MKISKKFILILLMIFFELHLKFIHGSKKKLQKVNIKNSKGLKGRGPVYIPPINNVVLLNNNPKEAIKNDSIKDNNLNFQYLFDIDADILDKGGDFIFKLKDSDLFNEEDEGDDNVGRFYIGNQVITYNINVENDSKIIYPERLQLFLNTYLSDLLVLFTIKGYLLKNEIEIDIEDKSRLIKLELKFKNKYHKNNNYQILNFLENNMILYRKILYFAIINILDDNLRIANSIFKKIYEKIFNNNKFYNNDLLKKEFLSKLNKIKIINNNIDIDDYESILYMVVYFINQKPNDFLKLLSDKKFLQFILSYKANKIEKNESILENEKVLNNEDLSMKKKEFQGIMQYVYFMFENILKF